MPYITKPYDHQIEMVKFGLKHPQCAFFCEMGTGKTKAAIDVIRNRAYANGVSKVLVIAPNSILDNWQREVNLHSKAESRILRGTRDKRLSLLHEPQKSLLTFYIINYEAVSGLKDELIKFGFDFVLCDESTKIKNLRAARTKACVAIGRKTPYRMILSGTPITQNVMDIHSQYVFLDGGQTFGWSFVSFRNKYFAPSVICCPKEHVTNLRYRTKSIRQKDGKTEFYCRQCDKWYDTKINKKSDVKAWEWVIRPGAYDEISRLMYTKAIRYTKEQCLDLPPKVYETRNVTLTKEEKRLYIEMATSLKTELKGQQISAQILLTKILRLSQIISGYVKDEDGHEIQIDNCSKFKELDSLIDEIDGKAIIWCAFTQNIERISELLKKKGIGHVTYYRKTKDKVAAEDEFQHNPECRFLIGQPASGGLGLNFTAASYVIYYSQGYSLENRLQSEDRAHRSGQTKKVTYIDLASNAEVDKRILKAVREKKNIADEVIDGWNKNWLVEE